jgi:conjugal transfer/entry exclusion protein
LHEGAEGSSGVGGAGLDYVAAINFENHFSMFKAMIEKSALLHFEFWNHLMDDAPDLRRLSEQGSRINASIHAVEDQWKKLT